MESEAAPVLKNMQLSSTENKCGKKLYRGTLCGEDAAVIVCGVGKVNAACGAQFMCDNFAPKAIINIGVAGGLNATMRAGEIYSISSTCQYDFDLVQLNGTPIGTLNEFTARLLPLSVTGDYAEKVLATGDRFNDDKKDFELLTEDIHADIRDMEGGAICAGVHTRRREVLLIQSHIRHCRQRQHHGTVFGQHRSLRKKS